MIKLHGKARPIVTLEQLVDKMAKEQTAHSRWDISSAAIAYSLLFITIVLVYFSVAREIIALIAVFGLCLVWLKAWVKGRKLHRESYDLHVEQFKIYIQEYVSDQTNKNELRSIITALAAAIDAKDAYTYGHSRKVAEYARDIAEALDYPQEEVEDIHSAALLHDIGKIGVPEQILLKQGELNKEEWSKIKLHPDRGISILKYVDGLKDILDAVQYHHERYDGSGYPKGLKGSQIPLGARILAVADSFDAMTSKRPYRLCEMTFEQALDELQKHSGSQFDSQVVNAFVSQYGVGCH